MSTVALTRPKSWIESLTDRLCAWIEKRGGMREIWRIENGREVLYLKRYYLYRFSWGEGMIHVFMRGDAGPVHDHPFASWGWILAGGYYEHTVTDDLGSGDEPNVLVKWRAPGHFGYRPGSNQTHTAGNSYHKVELPASFIDRGVVKTSFFTGSRNPWSWGFWDRNYTPFDKMVTDKSSKNRSPDDYTYGFFPVYKPKSS